MTLKSQPKCEAMTSASIKDRIEKVIRSCIPRRSVSVFEMTKLVITKLVCGDLIAVWMKSKNAKSVGRISHQKLKCIVRTRELLQGGGVAAIITIYGTEQSSKYTCSDTNISD